MADKAKEGDTVAVHYTGKLDTGEVFDSSQGRDPLEFEVGSGQVIAGFDQAVQGLAVGESREVRLEPEDAYGEPRDDLRVNVPRTQFPEGQEPEVGRHVEVQVAPGKGQPAKIVDVGEEQVTLDLNHPLAGQALTFDVELVEIK